MQELIATWRAALASEEAQFTLWILVISSLGVLAVVGILLLIRRTWVEDSILELERETDALAPFAKDLLQCSLSETSRKHFAKTATSYMGRKALRQLLLKFRLQVKGQAAYYTQEVFREFHLQDEPLKQLKSGSWDKKALALRLLSLMNCKEALPFAKTLAKHKEAALREEALLAILRLEHLDILNFVEKNHYALSEWMQYQLLHAFVEQDQTQLPDLHSHLKSNNIDVLRFCLNAIAWYWLYAYLPEVMGLLSHPSEAVRRRAVRTLARLGHKEALPALMKMLDKERESVQLEILKALEVLGDNGIAPSLRELEKNTKNWVLKASVHDTMHKLQISYEA